MWYTYIIESDTGRLYTGITTDIQRRWREHASGRSGARFFRTCRPARLRRLEAHPDRASASRREAAIKKLPPPQKRALAGESSPVPLPQTDPA